MFGRRRWPRWWRGRWAGRIESSAFLERASRRDCRLAYTLRCWIWTASGSGAAARSGRRNVAAISAGCCRALKFRLPAHLPTSPLIRGSSSRRRHRESRCSMRAIYSPGHIFLRSGPTLWASRSWMRRFCAARHCCSLIRTVSVRSWENCSMPLTNGGAPSRSASSAKRIASGRGAESACAILPASGLRIYISRSTAMKIDQFEMERMQSTWENVVEMDLSESGVRPVSLRELAEMGLDIDSILDTPLTYSQSNGTIPLRESLADLYPGATPDRIEVTNGTSEANYLLALTLVRDGDEVAFEVPNYMQYWGLPRSLGAKVHCFHLRIDRDWEPDWEEFDRAVNPRTRLVYISNPNNPSGSVLSREAMQRIVDRCESTGAWLIADEVYQGAEIYCERTASFWGMSDRVIVTSGLSKAYGIPGARIGWIAGPKDVIAECWTQHDYLTICPNKISDAIARVAEM